MMAQVNGVLNSVTRLPKSGILSAWLTSPGPIAGVSVNVGLASLDAAIDGRNGAKSLSSNEVFLGPGGTEIGLNTDPNAHLSLIPFIMEKFAFKKTKRLSESQLTARLERLIGCASAKSHRHSLFLAGTVPESHIGSCTELLGELMHGPAKFTDEDIEELYRMLQYESWELKQPLRFEDLLTDLAHRAAFNPSTTILSRSSPVLFDTSLESEKDAICGLLRKAADAYALHWENVVLKEPSRHFTIVGGGAEHCSKEAFMHGLEGSMPGAIQETAALGPLKDAYCGGFVGWEDDEAPLLNLSLCLKAPTTTADEAIPMGVLQTLLGGGGSFSAGGPGKGMYSRLYTQMLNRYSWLESAHAFSVTYRSNRVGGLFGIHGSCLPDRAPQLIKLLLAHFSTQLSQSLTTDELNRAKNQVKSAVLMGIESRSVQLESVSEQLAGGAGLLSPADVCSRIDRVSETDLIALARKMCRAAPLSIAAHGPLRHLPARQQIQDAFDSQFVAKLG